MSEFVDDEIEDFEEDWVKESRRRHEELGKEIRKERNEKPYPRQLIQYNYNGKIYYVMRAFDMGSNAVIATPDNKGLFEDNSSSTKLEIQTSLLYEILDEFEDQLYLPDDLQSQSLKMIKENHLESFQSELDRYCFARSEQKPEKHPLKNVDPKAAELVNMMLANFSLVTVEKEFPAPEAIISVETLTL